MVKTIIYNRPRTQVKYNCEEAKPYRNLRAVKWGPGDGALRALEQTHVEVTGPPVKNTARHSIPLLAVQR